MTPEKQVRSMLQPGEKILWTQAPSSYRFLGELLAQVFFGLIPFCFGSVFLAVVAWSSLRGGMAPPDLGGSLFAAAVGTGFVAIGISCFVAPVVMCRRLRDSYYVLTDRRALVITHPKQYWNLTPPISEGEWVMEFSAAQIRGYQRKWRDFGRTDLVFHSQWVRTSRRRSRWQPYGFLGVENPDEPQQLIEKHFSLSGAGEKEKVLAAV